MDKVKAAKIAIIIMTFLICLCFILLFYGINKKIKNMAEASREIIVTIDRNSQIKNISQFKDLLVLHKTVGEDTKIVIINPETGKVIYDLRLVEKAEKPEK